MRYGEIDDLPPLLKAHPMTHAEINTFLESLAEKNNCYLRSTIDIWLICLKNYKADKDNKVVHVIIDPRPFEYATKDLLKKRFSTAFNTLCKST